jgi:peptidyl-prolyl cis-trans isomerase C
LSEPKDELDPKLSNTEPTPTSQDPSTDSPSLSDGISEPPLPEPRNDDDDLAEQIPEDAPFGFSAADVRKHSERATSDSASDQLYALEEDEEFDDEYEESHKPNWFAIIGGLILLAAIGAGIGLLATRWSLGPGSEQNQAIARVGEDTITRAEFSRSWIDGQDPVAILDQLIDFELVVQAAKAEGVPADETAVDQQIEMLRAQMGNDEEQFLSFLQSSSIDSVEILRQLLIDQQMVDAMVNKYTQVEQAHASHILLMGDTPEAIEGRKSEAEALVKEIEGGADFATLASENSEDPGSQATGGDLGWAPRGVYVPEFEDAIFSMQPNEVRLVQSDFGWHIIKLLEGPEVRPLENRQYFQSQAVLEAFEKSFVPWVDQLRQTAVDNGQIEVLVDPSTLIPTPVPAPATAP